MERTDTPTRVDALAYARTCTHTLADGVGGEEGGGTLRKSSCDSQTWLLLHGRDRQTRATEENRKSGEHGRTNATLDGAALMTRKDRNERNMKQSYL